MIKNSSQGRKEASKDENLKFRGLGYNKYDNLVRYSAAPDSIEPLGLKEAKDIPKSSQATIKRFQKIP